MSVDLGGELVVVHGDLLEFLVVANHPFVDIILVSLDNFADFESMIMELLAKVHIVFISLKADVKELLLFGRLVMLLFMNFYKPLVYQIVHVLELSIKNVDIFFHFFAVALIFSGYCLHEQCLAHIPTVFLNLGRQISDCVS